MKHKLDVWIVKTNRFWERLFFTKRGLHKQLRKNKASLVFKSEYKI